MVQKPVQVLLSGIQVNIHSRLLVLVWVITWVTTLPLFHIHLPDISERLAAQGGVAHTVFSPDLPGEFSCFSSAQDHFKHLSSKVLSSPELGFVLSSACSNDREMAQTSALSDLLCPLYRPFLAAAALELSVSRRFLLFGASQGPRAPPSVASV